MLTTIKSPQVSYNPLYIVLVHLDATYGYRKRRQEVADQICHYEHPRLDSLLSHYQFDWGSARAFKMQDGMHWKCDWSGPREQRRIPSAHFAPVRLQPACWRSSLPSGCTSYPSYWQIQAGTWCHLTGQPCEDRKLCRKIYRLLSTVYHGLVQLFSRLVFVSTKASFERWAVLTYLCSWPCSTASSFTSLWASRNIWRGFGHRCCFSIQQRS